MPLFLLFVGAVFVVVALRGTYTQLGQQLQKDFTGSGNFLVWVGAIAVVGFAGYIKGIETPSRALLGLIIIAMFLANNGVFANFQQALAGASPSTAAQDPNQQPITTAPPVDLLGQLGKSELKVKIDTGQGGLGGILGGAGKAIGLG